MCYVNSDIILLDDTMSTINRIPFDKYLIAGQRRDVDIFSLIDYEDPEWENNLREYEKKNHKFFHGGIDYLIFPKGIFSHLPPFAVGRAGWDNWLIFYSRKLQIPTIDATQTMTAIHQNHSYSHVPSQAGHGYSGPESDHNFKLSGGRRIYLWNLDDVKWIITQSDLINKGWSFSECFRILILRSPELFHPLYESIFWLQHLVRYKELI